MAPKKDPFESGADDADEKAANQRDVQRVKQAAREEDEPEELEVGGDDDADDDDDGDAEPEPGRRAAKKRKRGEDMVRAANDRAERLEKLLEQSLSRQQQVVVQPPPRPEPVYDPNLDPLEQERRGLQAQVTNLHARAARATEAERAGLEEEAWKVRDQLDRNTFQRNARQYIQQQQPAQNPQQVAAQYAQMRIQEEHGDVLRQENTRLYCDGEWRKLLAMGKPDNFDTYAQAAEETRRAFRMPLKSQRPAPTSNQKKRFAGVSRGGAGATEERGSKTVKMTKERMKMADAFAPHIKDQKKRFQHWANTVGAKLVD